MGNNSRRKTVYLVAWAAFALVALIGLSFGSAYFVGMALTLVLVAVILIANDIAR